MGHGFVSHVEICFLGQVKILTFRLNGDVNVWNIANVISQTDQYHTRHTWETVHEYIYINSD